MEFNPGVKLKHGGKECFMAGFRNCWFSHLYIVDPACSPLVYPVVFHPTVLSILPYIRII